MLRRYIHRVILSINSEYKVVGRTSRRKRIFTQHSLWTTSLLYRTYSFFCRSPWSPPASETSPFFWISGARRLFACVQQLNTIVQLLYFWWRCPVCLGHFTAAAATTLSHPLPRTLYLYPSCGRLLDRDATAILLLLLRPGTLRSWSNRRQEEAA